MQGVYRIRNILDDKRYVGSTNDFEKGWIYRLKALKKEEHHNPHLQNAWNKCGEKNFVFEIEKEVMGNNKVLLAAEQIYLDEGFGLGILYNIARKAGGGNLGEEVNQKRGIANTGRKHTAEWKQEQSKRMSGKNSPLYGKRGKDSPNYGSHRTEETKTKMRKPNSKEHNAKISKTLTGYKHIDEFRAKMRKINMGANNPFYGKQHTKETKEKMGDSHAKPYPAFYNSKTGEFISAGINLRKMCRNQCLSHTVMNSQRTKVVKRSRSGWRLATAQEIKQFENK